MKKLILAALIGTVALAPAAHAETTHCPDHNSPDVTKIQGNNNDFVPAAGTLFCVKASTRNTGQLTADGTTSLIKYVEAAGIVNDNGKPHDVSYYVVYGAQVQPAQEEQKKDEQKKDEQKKDEQKKDEKRPDSDVDGDDLGDCPVEMKDAGRCDGDAAKQSGVDVNAGAAASGSAAGTDASTSVAASDLAFNAADATSAPPADAAATAAGQAPAEPRTEVLGETLERGPSTLARTGAGLGGLALLGGALCGGGRLAVFARRFLRLG